MHEVDAVKTIEQRRQIEAHLSELRQIYADIWKVGVNTALRISDLLSLTMEEVRDLDPTQLALRLKEQKTGKLRKIIINPSTLAVMRRRLAENPKHVWLFQSDAVNLNRRQAPKPIKSGKSLLDGALRVTCPTSALWDRHAALHHDHLIRSDAPSIITWSITM